MSGPNDSEASVGIVYWEPHNAVVDQIAQTIAGLGCRTVRVQFDAEIPPDLDYLFIHGPNGGLAPLVLRLRSMPTDRRPTLILYHSEQFPNPRLPAPLRYAGGLVRSAIDRAGSGILGERTWHESKIAGKALRFRYYGDLFWLRSEGFEIYIAVPSALVADDLRELGFEVIHAEGFGLPHVPEWGADLGLERDVPVLWLGKPGSKRRGRLIERIRGDLARRGVEMMVVDGVEQPYVFGEERTRLLNRTKVVLNILRTPWDENALRYYLAGLNRALVVTEPTLPHHPAFVPDVHLAVAPLDNIVDRICHYLDHEEERRRIADQAFDLVTNELTLENAMRHTFAVASSRG